MVRALQRLAATAPLGHDGGAVAADVDEAVQAPVMVAHDDHRHQAGVSGQVLARDLHPVGDADVLPGVGEDASLLLAEDVRVGEPAEGQGDALVEAGAKVDGHGANVAHGRLRRNGHSG